MNYSTDTLFNNSILIVILPAIIGTFLLLAFLVNVYFPFKEERARMKMEIERSFGEDEEEYLYWKRELKILYLSKIPIIGPIIKRRYKK